MNNSNNLISKTAYLKFEQCKKAFYFYKKHPYLRDKISIDKQLTFKRGHEVGDLAQSIFPGGIDISKNSKNSIEALHLTQTLISNKTPVIYEATFSFNSALIMVDILCLEDGEYTAYEVKSSFKISEVYLKDACLQYYVLKNILVNFNDLFLVTLNQDYVFQDELNLKQLFKKRSVKTESEKNLEYFDLQLNNAKFILSQNIIPNITIGKHCFKPYQCDYFGNCWKDAINQDSIFNLPLINKEKLMEWYNSNIKTISQINENEEGLKSNISKIKNAFLTNNAIIEKKEITNFLSTIKFPVAAMDMEIWGPAIPKLNGTKPFEQIPYLVSFFNGESHSSVFMEYKDDERKAFAEKLINYTKQYNSILVFDGTLEKLIINNLIKHYNDLKSDLETLKNKLVDVFDVFLNLNYYHPDFKTNFSLKTISAALLNDINYSKINSGLEAMNYYEQYRTEKNDVLKQLIKEDLISYCETDTLATFKLVDFLSGIVK